MQQEKGRGGPEAELELLVEVAVVDAPVPADADSTAAHDSFCGSCVEASQQQLHVIGQLPLALQVIHVALDGHVVQAQQAVEANAVSFRQLSLVRLLQQLVIYSLIYIVTRCEDQILLHAMEASK